MRRVDVVFFLPVSQTTCRVTSCQRSVPASSPQSSPLRSTWWRPGTWTHRQASTTAPSTVPGPWWLKRGQRLSTRGKLCLSDRGSMFGFKIPSSPDFFFFFLLQRFVPSFLRLGSWNVVMFVSFEQIKRAMMVTKKNIEAHNWDHSFTVELKTWSGPEAVRGTYQPSLPLWVVSDRDSVLWWQDNQFQGRRTILCNWRFVIIIISPSQIWSFCRTSVYTELLW